MEASDLLVEALFVESVSAVEYRKDGAVVAAGLFLRRSKVREPNRPGVGFGRRWRTAPCIAGQQRYSGEHD
jgi:hypothetical protein